jgi:integrase
MLSALEIKHAKPGLHPDGAGLYLQVTKGGTKSWIFRFQVNGRRREMGLGSLEIRSVTDARAEAAILSREVRAKIDPLERRRADAAAEHALQIEQASRSITFESVAREYIEAHTPGWRNAKHVQQWNNTLATYAYPHLAQKAVADISTDDVLSILKPIWVSKSETASRIRSRIELILSYAKAKGLRTGENPAIWRGHLDALLPKPSKVKRVVHRPALALDDLKTFTNSLAKIDGIGARALEFLILTAARSGEVRLATWAEVDFNARVWTVPAARMKAGKEHRVPLSDRAMEVLREITPTEDCEFIFAGQRHRRPVSDMTLLAVIRRMNEKNLRFVDRRTGDPVVPHGFRSTFRDWASELTAHPSELAEMALAHTIGSKVEAAYRRGDMFERRRTMMAEWASFTAS